MREAQRTMVLEAMAEAMSARGADGATVTIADVLERSGVPSVAFHEAFLDREACLLGAFELGVERARKRMAVAYDVEPRWLDAVKAALAAFLRFIEAEPALARLLVVYSLSGGETVLRRRVEVLDALADLVDYGRLEGPPGRLQPAAVIGEGVIGAVLAVLHKRLLEDQRGPVIELFGSLVSIIVLPYLGAAVARRELARPAPPARSAGSGAKGAARPLATGGGVRLTQRTARVLGAIADYPGASNREVADRAGVVDQGQISKLLSRLHAAELIAKLGDARASRGAPNAWCLTERGETLLRSFLSRELPH